MGFWAAVPAIAGMISAVATGVKATKERNAKNNNNIAAWAPIAAAAAQNTLQGINNRKIRKYNEPKNQVRRLREAGLPLAAGSSISAGGGVSTPVGSFGFEQFNDNIGKGTLRAIDRKKLELAVEELAIQKANAIIAGGNAKNLLNPSGTFENTNQGTTIRQAIQSQEEALKAAQTVNKWMPLEKAQNIMKSNKEIEQISSNIQNTLLTNQIHIQDLAIKKILAKYQEDMSFQELQSIIKENAGKDFRNLGMDYDNAIKRVGYTIELATMAARIEMAKNAAVSSGQSVEAGRLANVLTNLSLPSTQAYYEIRRGMDDATKAKPNLPNTLLYLGMFQPNTSNYNFGQLMPRLPSGGNTYNTNNYIKGE